MLPEFGNSLQPPLNWQSQDCKDLPNLHSNLRCIPSLKLRFGRHLLETSVWLVQTNGKEMLNSGGMKNGEARCPARIHGNLRIAIHVIRNNVIDNKWKMKWTLQLQSNPNLLRSLYLC